jgi:hypothetical protein
MPTGSVCQFDEERFYAGQATQCIGYIRKNGAQWWHTEYKPLLVEKWGARRVAALVKKMEMVKNEK